MTLRFVTFATERNSLEIVRFVLIRSSTNEDNIRVIYPRNNVRCYDRARMDIKPHAILRFRQIAAIILPHGVCARARARVVALTVLIVRTKSIYLGIILYYIPAERDRNPQLLRQLNASVARAPRDVSADRVLRSLAPTANSTDTQLRNCPRISSTGPLFARKGPPTHR